MAFTLNPVETLMPTRKPRGLVLTRAQKAANRRIARRRVRMEHVTAASNAVAWFTTPAACARLASVIWSWKSAVGCITFGYV
jgi:hypothetical protein